MPTENQPEPANADDLLIWAMTGYVGVTKFIKKWRKTFGRIPPHHRENLQSRINEIGQILAEDEQSAENQHARIYQKYQSHTMHSWATYRANLELAEMARSVAGCVIECGVWRGGMIAGIAELLGPDRDYYLFDSFQGLPPARAIDGTAAIAWQADTSSPAYHDNCSVPESFAREAMSWSAVPVVHIRPGWFEETLPTFVPGGPIALLRLDGDWYESTMTCLRHLIGHMAPGGLVIIDDYYGLDGCARAVHDFLSQTGSRARIQQWHNDVYVCYLQIPGVEPGPPAAALLALLEAAKLRKSETRGASENGAENK